jgi:hypothetical protein
LPSLSDWAGNAYLPLQLVAGVAQAGTQQLAAGGGPAVGLARSARDVVRVVALCVDLLIGRAAAAGHAPADAQRRLLGAMEATQSSVVDVENVDALLYDITNVQKVQPIPADMRLRISIGKPNFVLPNLDSVNHQSRFGVSCGAFLTRSLFSLGRGKYK